MFRTATSGARLMICRSSGLSLPALAQHLVWHGAHARVVEQGDVAQVAQLRLGEAQLLAEHDGHEAGVDLVVAQVLAVGASGGQPEEVGALLRPRCR